MTVGFKSDERRMRAMKLLVKLIVNELRETADRLEILLLDMDEAIGKD